MKDIFNIILVFVFLVGFSAKSQTLLNNGANINALSGAYIHVNGSVKNDFGLLAIDAAANVPAEIYITEDIVNNSSLIGSGHIRLLGDWYNNSIFTSATGTVFLQGSDQLISGTVESNFFNLTLDGSGLKTQEINAFCSGVLDLKHLELQTEVYSFYVENTALNSVQRTSGFVSSLNGGFLSRRTEQLATYLFPVGSSVGTTRYRPVELRPNFSPNNTFEVRMANLDATLEGFDRSLTDSISCELNPLFYHQINRSNGISSVDLNIYFSETEDGLWAGISNWKQSNVHWEHILSSGNVSSTPLSYAFSDDWSDFDDTPYILSHVNEIPIFDSIPPVCQNDSSPELPNISLNGFSGTWSGSIDSGLPGTQTFIFTPDPNQCALSTMLSVEVMELPQIDAILMAQEIFCHGEEGMLEIQTTGSNLMYGINGSEMVLSNQFVVSSGMHTIFIVDEHGCENSINEEVTEPSEIDLQATVLDILCPEGLGAIELEINGGVPGYAVVWNDEFFSEDIFNLETGYYSCIVTDDNDCQDSLTVEVNETLSGSASILNNSGNTQLTCATTEIELEAVGGTNFTWSGGTSPNSATNNITEPGNYFVDYLDSNGCELQMNVLISEDITSPIVSIDNITNITNELNCNEPEITLFGSGADSYVWEDSINNISTTVSSPGEYQVVGVGWNGCADSTTIMITADFSPPNIFIQNLSGIDTLDCNTTSVGLQVNGGLSYEWADGLGSATSVTVSSGGIYAVTGIGFNGCSNSDSIEIIEIPFPTLSVNSETICSGNTIELIAEASIPGGNYTWSGGLGNSSSVTVAPVSNAFYTVNYELNGCESNTATSTIFVLPTPVVTISGPNSICSSESVTLTSNPSLPGGTYEWFPGGEVSSSITSFPPTSSVFGVSYTLDGCPSDTAEINIEVIPTPVVTLQDVSICAGESGTLSALPSVPGGTYNWVPFGYATQSITESPDTTTSYSVLYSANGCMSQLTSATIFVNPIPELTVEDIGICQGQSGYLNAVASIDGGSYLWTGFSENSSTLEVSPNFTSNYTVSYELNNCLSSMETAIVTVTEQPLLSPSDDQGICEGDSISLFANPSVLGGNFTWLPGNETSASIIVSPFITTEYQVMYEINGCETDYETINVSVDAMPITTFDVNVTSGCPPLNVVFTNTTDNTTNCNWTINNGTTFEGCDNSSYTFLDEGCYDITLNTETPNGCPGLITMNSLICVLPSPDLDFSMSTNQISYGSSQVDFMNNSSNAVDYLWDFGDGNTDTLYYPDTYEYDINDESFFIVTLNGTTDLGCTDSLQLELLVNQDAVIFAPNTFTPDGDGLNDFWFPTISPGIDQDFFGVQIFNRWGELIFEAKDFQSAWDGTYQGNKVPVGTYTYRIDYKEKQSEQREIIVGHVSLIR